MARADPFTCWLLDTRSLWPGERIQDAAAAQLCLVSPEERRSICRKMHMADAKMSLASALLKRAFVCKTFRVPWSSVRFARKGDPVHGKPCYILPTGAVANVDFNVSHQAGLVCLVGSRTSGVQVGIDITCVNERNDYRHIDKEGLDSWVDMYEDVFSHDEIWDIKYNVDSVTLLDGTEVCSQELGRHDRACRRDLDDVEITLNSGLKRTVSAELIVDAKLRRFYAFYAYKEAYVKLVGEGLLATWLRELEFRNVRSPKPGTRPRCSALGAWGEKVDDVEVWLHGERLHDVRMDIQAYEEDYLVTTAIRCPAGAKPGKLPRFEAVNLQRDVLAFAEERPKAPLAVSLIEQVAAVAHADSIADLDAAALTMASRPMKQSHMAGITA